MFSPKGRVLPPQNGSNPSKSPHWPGAIFHCSIVLSSSQLYLFNFTVQLHNPKLKLCFHCAIVRLAIRFHCWIVRCSSSNSSSSLTYASQLPTPKTEHSFVEKTKIEIDYHWVHPIEIKIVGTKAIARLPVKNVSQKQSPTHILFTTRWHPQLLSDTSASPSP